MDPATVIADAAYIVTILNEVVTTFEDALPFIKALYGLVVKNQPLTDDVRASLKVQEDALRAQLNAPLIAADQS